MYTQQLLLILTDKFLIFFPANYMNTLNRNFNDFYYQLILKFDFEIIILLKHTQCLKLQIQFMFNLLLIVPYFTFLKYEFLDDTLIYLKNNFLLMHSSYIIHIQLLNS